MCVDSRPVASRKGLEDPAQAQLEAVTAEDNGAGMYEGADSTVIYKLEVQPGAYITDRRAQRSYQVLHGGP